MQMTREQSKVETEGSRRGEERGIEAIQSKKRKKRGMKSLLWVFVPPERVTD